MGLDDAHYTNHNTMITSLSLTKNISLIALLCCTLSFAFANTEIVMNTNDSGAGSLRQAVVDAMPGDTITFDASLDMDTIKLTTGEITLSEDIVIIGNDTTNTIIDGNANSRIFHITVGISVVIHGVALHNGKSDGTQSGLSGRGGAILNEGVLGLFYSKVAGNTTIGQFGDGGGVANSGSNTEATFTNTSIYGNTAGRCGGGVFNLRGQVTFINTSISGNTANDDGGGVSNLLGGEVAFTNTTISGNTASLNGGGVHNTDSQVTFNNTMVAKNTDNGSGPDIFSLGSTIIDIGNNLIGDGTGQTVIINNNNGNKVGTAGLPLDPLFVMDVPSTAMGPSTDGDLRLQSNSPAIDMGNNTAVLTPYDKDGFQRIIGGTVDIGAHEYLGTCTGPGNKNFFVTTSSNTGTGSLRDNVSIACSGDTIRFAAITDGFPINLTNEIALDSNLVIIGNQASSAGLAPLTILDGNANSRIFHITAGNTVEIHNITLQNGNGDGLQPAGVTPMLTVGGAIFNQGVLSLLNSKVVGNTASFQGGGVYSSVGDVTFTNSAVSGNTAPEGGGVLNVFGVVTYINSTISGNTAQITGGGIYNFQGQATFSNSVVSGNTAVHGAGVENSGQATFNNTTISGNTASLDGAGLKNLGQATFTNTTISGNTAINGLGGGVANFGGLITFTNTIVAKNFDNGQGPDIFHSSGTITDEGHNLISDTTSVGSFFTISSLLGSTTTPINPLFIMDVPPTGISASIGGDLRLQSTSPAINVGNTASLPTDIFDLDGDGDVSEPHPIDLSGSPRVVECTVDIGAYEYQTVIQGATIFVNKASTTGSNDGTSWADAFLHLQDALRLRCGAEEIWVAEGEYDPDEGAGFTEGDRSASFIMQNSLKILGGFPDSGNPALADRNPDSLRTFLVSLTPTGSPDPVNRSYHVIRNEDNGLDTTALLDGFSIQGGLADGMGADAFGGGMYNKNSSPLISNCEFSLNEASQEGGGVYNEGGAPIFRHVTFSQNDALDGGAMYNNNFGTAPIIEHSTFNNNEAAGSGGAIYNLGADMDLINSELYNNVAMNQGGAIFNNSILANIDIINCSFSNNSAAPGEGASAFNSSLSNINIHNSILWGTLGNEIEDQGTSTVTYSIVQGGWPGTGNLDEDPHYTSTADLQLSVACSPAINSGSDSFNTTTLDLRGNPRKVGTIDMGAFEFQGQAADTITFDAGGNATDWHDASNWDLNIIPARCHDVIIPSPHNVMISTGNTGIGKTLQINVGAMLETASGGLIDIDKR